MATKIWTDGTTALDAAELNEGVGLDQSKGRKKEVISAYAVVRNTGSAWDANLLDTAGIADGDIAWDTNHAEVTLDHGYSSSAYPVVLTSPYQSGMYLPSSISESETQANIYYRDYSGTLQTTENDSNNTATTLIIGGGTKIWSDSGSDDLDEAELNKMVHKDQSDGANDDCVMAFAKIKYDGSEWVVDSAYDSCGINSSNLTWDTDHVEIDVTGAGFANYPIVVASPTGTTGTANYLVSAVSESATLVSIYFWDHSFAAQTTEGTQMDFMLMVISE